MIPIADFEQTAREKLLDAKCLLDGERFDGAIYMAGYALEIAIKVKLCHSKEMPAFPDTYNEWKDVAGALKKFDNTWKKPDNAFDKESKSWKEHLSEELVEKLDEPLKSQILVDRDWNKVRIWSVDLRYRRNMATKSQATGFINAIENIANNTLEVEL